MNDELSDDLASWPKDPFKLLGVRLDADAKELKLAYVRLIKRFKPEQFPEHFRRIREAYEFASSDLAFRALFGSTFDEPDLSASTKSAANTSESETESSQESGGSPAPAAPNASVVERAWRMACGGEWPDAYRELGRAFTEDQNQSESAVRLYWLLRLTPDLDPERQPIDWLADSLRHHRIDRRCQELLRRELMLNPSSAWSAGLDRLLDSDLDAEQLAELIRWRWQAAAVSSRRRLIVDDMERFRPRLKSAPRLWVQLLFMAADVLIWGGPHGDAVFESCRDEISSFDYLTNDFAYMFDRLDHLEILFEHWWSIRQLLADDEDCASLRPVHRTQSVLALIPRIWMLPDNLLIPELLGFAATVAAESADMLEYFDRIANHGPTIVSCLANALRELPERSPVDAQTDIDEIIPGALRSQTFWDNYNDYRGTFLEFCISNLIDPILTAAVLTRTGLITQSGYTPSNFVKSDFPLQAAYYATDRTQS
jgi:hypothetical protein